MYKLRFELWTARHSARQHVAYLSTQGAALHSNISYLSFLDVFDSLHSLVIHGTRLDFAIILNCTSTSMKKILLRLKKLLGPFRLRQSPLSAPRAMCTNVTTDKPRAGFDNWVAGHPRDEHAEDPSHESRLESLPPEVHRILLSTLRLNELRALVLSSPIIHERYLLDRRYLLCRSLENTLGSVSVDAYAVFQSSSAEFAKSRTREVISSSLTLYQDWRNAPQQAKLPTELTEQEAISMIAFHSSIVNPLAKYYTTWALNNLAGEDGGLQSHAPLSCTEQTRLMRALYRFQLSCNLFGRGHFASTLQPPLRFEAVDILSMFLCLFEPWEAEEIGCINTFAKEKYDQVSTDIRWDVHEENPKFDGRRPPTPEGAFDFDNSCRSRAFYSLVLMLILTQLTWLCENRG